MTTDKKIKGQKTFETIKAMLPSGRFTLKALLRSVTRSNITDIQNAIRARESLDIIKSLLQNEKDTSILSHFLLNKPVLDPSKLISEDTSYIEVLKSKFPVIGKYLTDMTTLYDICIENYSNDPKYYKEVFEFLLELEQKKPQKNFAELAVKLAQSSENYPEASDEFLKIMQDMHEIDLDEISLMVEKPLDEPVKDGMHNNSGQQNTQNDLCSSKKRSSFSPLHKLVEVYNRSKQEQALQEPIGVTMPLGKFLSSEASGNQKIVAFAEAIMPSKSFVDPNLTQPKELQSRGI